MSRKNILKNRLVLVSNKNSALSSKSTEQENGLTPLLENAQRIVIGDPSHVPLGIYTQEALENLELWNLIEHKTARMSESRMVTKIIERNEASLGIIYESDTHTNPDIKVLHIINENKHSPILYSVAQTQNCDSSAIEFYNFLTSKKAQIEVSRLGFQNIGSIE